jgi:uncharacterized Zn finger protein (UPF0148 family)
MMINITCPVCGDTDPESFFSYEGELLGPLCIACGMDQWEAQQPEREQKRREQLDSEGYYDDPKNL